MYKHLISTQRLQIFAYKQCGKPLKFIAQAIEVHESTIYRELSRNRNKRGGYAHNAHEMAMERQERIAVNRNIKQKSNFDTRDTDASQTHTGYVIIHRLKHGKKARELASAVNRLLLTYRSDGVLTITTNNGPEFSQHQKKLNLRPRKTKVF